MRILWLSLFAALLAGVLVAWLWSGSGAPTQIEVAEQTIHHDASHPSHIVLPLHHWTSE